MTPPEPYRDDELGSALRDLPAPPHGSGFEDRLHALLADEAASRRKAPRRRWALRPLPSLAAATALAALVVLVVAVLPGSETRRIGPAPASAAEVVNRAGLALARVHSLRATLVVRQRIAANEPLTTTRLRVALTDRGDLRVLGGKDSGGDFYYSERTGREVQLDAPSSPGAFVTEGVASGAPDGLIGDRSLGLQAAAFARSLAAARDGSIKLEQVDGRPAWVLTTAIAVNKLGFSGDRLTVVVDRVTGFPIAVRETLKGRLVQGFELQKLQLDPKLSASTFTPSVPSTATVFDEGFQTVTLAGVEAKVGYAPLVPSRLPSGYRVAETRVAATTPSPTGNEALNPPSRDVVSTAYRRGLDRVIVSTRKTGGAEWADPIASGEGNQVQTERVKLTAGALKGATANVVIDPHVEPHAWVVTDKLVVTITGPLTRDQLVAAATSLAARP